MGEREPLGVLWSTAGGTSKKKEKTANFHVYVTLSKLVVIEM